MKDKTTFLFQCLLALFLTLSAAFCIWLYFPGFNNYYDFIESLAVLKRDGWHAVFPAFLLGVFYKLFGTHAFYLYIGNIAAFHLAIFFIVFATARHSKTLACAVLLLAPTANLYLNNVLSWSPQNLACGLLLLYALVLYFILTPPPRK